MGSTSLVKWRGVRQRRIRELLDAHTRIGGSGAGRRWQTEQLNWALVLRIAAEFQGFARDLHDQGADYFVTRAAGGNASLASVLNSRLMDNRDLTRGNAHPGALGNDFGRLGLQLWPALGHRYRRAAAWNRALEALNAARNAIAHAEDPAIAALNASGWPLTRLSTVQRFHRTTDQLARGMDTVVAAHLSRLFGGAPPW